ncbi:aminotransferase class III-fold pyridoxal phosphate-dependent enzyme [Saccharopolyspora elongata]|uniref:Aminotransferase class III-fold pyridoxal phosphate-dependent enzyme n=1 Tax=Saccharopolyspora elongata TaxID=2530387 RepID=A0A4V2YJN4_9PSEU|nr:aminotransferase class III-fold pyridoxal phosphate-dependent enzyme [Saccharopolyspora elongata]TDD39547.1 aminotransferase class III-fold pyridoxal phosphate-dependent enzyme [Saccharopolyspora elongata]
MTLTSESTTAQPADGRLGLAARDHLMRGYGEPTDGPVSIITRGEGPYVWDEQGRRYLDAVAGAFVVQVGYGRPDLAATAARQAAELAYFPAMEHAPRPAVELAERLAAAAPGDLNRVFFTCGGSEAVDSAWKLARQYFALTGRTGKHKVISREWSFHGSTYAAVAMGGFALLHQIFEPRGPVSRNVADPYDAEEIRAAIEQEGPESVAAVILEPLPHPSACVVPPEGYFARVREICDQYDVLLISDDIVDSFGRLGHLFGCDRFGFQPDIICCAKGITSGYAPLGATIASERLLEPFLPEHVMFAHGYTFSGHPVSTSVAMANMDILEQERIYEHVLRKEAALRNTLEGLRKLPVVNDVQGAGFLFSLELIKDKATQEPFSPEECEQLIDRRLRRELFEAGLHIRCGDHDKPYIHLAPPLICDQPEFDEIAEVLRAVLPRLSAWV